MDVIQQLLDPTICKICGCRDNGNGDGTLSEYFADLLDNDSKFKKLHDVYDVLKADFAEVKSMVTQLLQKIGQ